MTIISFNDRSSIVAAGVDLGYSFSWIVGFLADRSRLQQNGFEAVREVYGGIPPKVSRVRPRRLRQGFAHH